VALLTRVHVVARKGRPEKKRQAGVRTRDGKGWQSRERKLKELKHEGHIALGNEIANEVTCNHMWVEFCFLLL
jgi:hypothetical protein